MYNIDIICIHICTHTIKSQSLLYMHNNVKYEKVCWFFNHFLESKSVRYTYIYKGIYIYIPLRIKLFAVLYE